MRLEDAAVQGILAVWKDRRLNCPEHAALVDEVITSLRRRLAQVKEFNVYAVAGAIKEAAIEYLDVSFAVDVLDAVATCISELLKDEGTFYKACCE